jgi:hypothetical protein
MEEEIETKQDMIDRKAAWLERMFDRLFIAVQQNPFATMLILSVGLNFWQYNVINEMNRLRIQEAARIFSTSRLCYQILTRQY